MNIRYPLTLLFLTLSTGALLSCSATPPAGEPVVLKSETLSDTGREETTIVQASAIVQKIDYKTRKLTLKSYDGALSTINVGKEVVNFPQIKKGDEILITYAQSVAYDLRAPTAAERADPSTLDIEAAKAAPGQLPAGAIAGQLRTIVKVTKIDNGAGTVTVKGPKGNVLTVKAKYPDRLKLIKVGDTIVVTYTEAIALTVERQAKK